MQVEFGKHVLGARVPRVQDSDSLYSIPQVVSSSASASSATSTTRLTASLVKVSGTQWSEAGLTYRLLMERAAGCHYHIKSR